MFGYNFKKKKVTYSKKLIYHFLKVNNTHLLKKVEVILKDNLFVHVSSTK